MAKRLSKEQLLFKAKLDETCVALNIPRGVFKEGTKHDSYTVTLPNGAPVKMAVYCTVGNVEGYAGTLHARLRSNIQRHLERGGNT